MSKIKVSVIIPVYNEMERLEEVIAKLDQFDEVLIVDDGSNIPVESYIDTSKYSNIKIYTNTKNLGYLQSIKKAFTLAKNEIVVTMDGDGEHQPDDIIKLIRPIQNEQCDVVFGKRPEIARPSEKFLLFIAKFLTKEKVKDSGTGFRALKKDIAQKLELNGKCTCGLFLLELHFLGAKICEVLVRLPKIDKPRKIAWEHFWQFFILIKFYFDKIKAKE